MPVVSDGFDFRLGINERVQSLVALAFLLRGEARVLVRPDGVMRAALPRVARALNHVEEMRNDARLDEALAVLVEVHAPRIARAFGENFELMLRGMITPHRGIDPLALCFRRAGLADIRRTEHAVTSVKPAVRRSEEHTSEL